MKHVIVLLVENQPGVLARIVGLVSGRGYNIESLNVAPTLDPSISRMTLTVPGDDRVLDQVTKQLNKLVDVVKVSDLTKKKTQSCELIMVEVAVAPERRQELTDLAGLFDAKVAAVQERSLTIQLVADQDRIADFLAVLKPFRVIEIARSGVVIVPRSEGKK
jgi:acetolactate synthase-1/3 small subunit